MLGISFPTTIVQHNTNLWLAPGYYQAFLGYQEYIARDGVSLPAELLVDPSFGAYKKTGFIIDFGGTFDISDRAFLVAGIRASADIGIVSKDFLLKTYKYGSVSNYFGLAYRFNLKSSGVLNE